MATSLEPVSLSSPAVSEVCQRLSRPPYDLHKAVFEGDIDKVRDVVKRAADSVNATDCHGNQWF